MRLEPILAFLLFSVVTTVTPGPNNVMLTATGANFGVRRGMPHILGIGFGFSVMQLLVIGTAGTALTSFPPLLTILRVFGIAVLLWLSFKIAMAGRPGAAKHERPMSFLGAAAFQWVNPKAWLICAGAVSFLQADAAPLPQAALFAVIFFVTGIPSMLVWLGFGAAMQRVLRTERAAGLQRHDGRAPRRDDSADALKTSRPQFGSPAKSDRGGRPAERSFGSCTR